MWCLSAAACSPCNISRRSSRELIARRPRASPGKDRRDECTSHARTPSETRRSDLPSSGHRQMANTLHLTMRDAIVALVLPFLTPARAACSTRAPRSSSTVSAAAPPALDFLLLDHVKVAAAADDGHSRRTELDNSTAVAMKPCRCRRVEPAALPAFALQSRLQRSELAVGTPPSSSRLTASASGCV